MVNCPEQLVWECIKHNNRFLQKRNGRTKRSGQITFSTEVGNLKSLNLFKYSGLANKQTVDVVCTDDHKAKMVTKTKSKCDSQPKQGMAVTMVNKDFRGSEKIMQKTVLDNHYRPDLKPALLGKYTKVYQANRRAKGITKPTTVKKGRGKL